MFLHLCVILFKGELASQHASQVKWPGGWADPPPGLPTEGPLGRPPRSAYRGGWADPSMGYYGLQSASIVLDLNQFVHQKRRLDGVFQHHSPKSKYSLC